MRFEWNERCQTAFETLKECLANPPVLAIPRQDGEFILDTDCSDVAAAAILHQVIDGEERVISFGSKMLSKAEQLYCTTRKELLAIVFFCETLQMLLSRTSSISYTNRPCCIDVPAEVREFVGTICQVITIPERIQLPNRPSSWKGFS